MAQSGLQLFKIASILGLIYEKGCNKVIIIITKNGEEDWNMHITHCIEVILRLILIMSSKCVTFNKSNSRSIVVKCLVMKLVNHASSPIVRIT